MISLFRQDLHVYEVHNNGAWYNLGFLGGGSGGATARRTLADSDDER